MNHFHSTCIAAALALTAACSASETEAASPASSTKGQSETGVEISQPSTSDIESADTDAVIDMQKNIIVDTIAMLKSIKDVESAKAALPQLKSIAERIKPLISRREQIEGQNPLSKMAFGKATLSLVSLTKPLSDEGSRLNAIDGVKEILEPVMDEIFSLFKPK